MLAWQKRRGMLSGYLEIDQDDLVSNPRESVARIGDYLGYDGKALRRLGKFFESSFPERSAASYDPIAMDVMPWCAEEIQVFRRVCGPAMRAWSYTYDKSYRQIN